MNDPQLIPSRKLLTVIAVAVFSNGIGPVARAQFSANYQTNTISAVTSNWTGNGTYVVGSNTFLDTLIVQGGGVLSNGTGYIGYETSASNNTAIIRGASSAWTNQFDLHVGFESAGNRLVISNGAVVVNSNAFVGTANFLGNTNNSVLVTDPGSVWTNTGGITIGMLSAGNQVVISNGAKVIDQGLDIGDHSGGATNGASIDNSALVTETNSMWMNYGFVGLDRNSPGLALKIANGGGFFSSTEAGIANSAASDGINVLVTDPGSIWTVGGIITISDSGYDNYLIITNGGLVQADKIFIADQPGSSGALTIAGGTNELSSYLQVGTPGSTATVTVASGALFVTNALGTASTLVNGSGNTLILGQGTFKTDSLTVTNGG